MRKYWDERARKNAAWYVDTSLSYDDPNFERFFETGKKIVAEAIDEAPVLPPSMDHAVEIGCGLGRVCVALAERFERVTGVDISSEMLERAREVANDPKVTYLLGDGSTLAGIDDASADLVLTFTVFQHIPSIPVIERYIAEAGRILRPGGVFVFQWNNTPGTGRWQLKRAVLSALQRVGFGEKHERNAPEFMGSRVPMVTIDAALAAGGLKMERVKGEDTLYAWAWASKRG
jgi:ubiquinone/menaquinone biosynthesis C-methylase UbiE